jgi:hypothetical protein
MILVWGTKNVGMIVVTTGVIKQGQHVIRAVKKSKDWDTVNVGRSVVKTGVIKRGQHVLVI